MRILLVEDEQDLRETLEYNLQREGFSVEAVGTGAAALIAAVREPLPDLIVLDLMLPDMSGTEICRRIRATPATTRVPVLMVTARTDEIDRVVGFEVGADDYVTKPFSVRELLLRIRAILRRASPGEAEVPGATQAFGRLKVDTAGHRTWVDGQLVELTALEFRMLDTFLGRKGRVQSRDALVTEVWGEGYAVTERTVDTHIKRLRAKLGPAGRYIETLRGVGYRFTDDPGEA